jgi:hypothetical protein
MLCNSVVATKCLIYFYFDTAKYFAATTTVLQNTLRQCGRYRKIFCGKVVVAAKYFAVMVCTL